MKEITSLERIRAVLEHREPDRIPFDLGATHVTGIHQKAYRRLREHLGLPEREIAVEEPIQQLAKVDEDVKERLKADVDAIGPKRYAGVTPTESADGEYLHFVDDWGVERRMPKDGGLYYDMSRHPMAGLPVEDVKVRWHQGEGGRMFSEGAPVRPGAECPWCPRNLHVDSGIRGFLRGHGCQHEIRRMADG
jgi:hypothetical protein